MTKVLTLLCLSASIAVSQSQPDIVACNLSIEGSATMQQLYGKRVPLYTGSVVGKNYSQSVISISSVDVYLALSTVNRLPNADASAILTKAFDTNPIQTASGTVGLIAAGVGAAVATSHPLAVGGRVIAWLLFGVTFGQNSLVPFLTRGQPSLSSLLANQCEGMGSQGTLLLQPAGTFSCNMFIQKASNAAVLPSNIPFDLSIDAPPPPGVLPPVQPLQIRMARPMRAGATLRYEVAPSPKSSIHINPAVVAPVTANSTPLQPNWYVCWSDTTYGMLCNNPTGTTLQPSVAYPLTQPATNQPTCSCAGSLEACLAACSAQLQPAQSPAIVTPTTFHINPDAAVLPPTHADYGRRLYYQQEYAQSVREYNAAIRENPGDVGLFIELADSLSHSTPESRAMATIIREHAAFLSANLK